MYGECRVSRPHAFVNQARGEVEADVLDMPQQGVGVRRTAAAADCVAPADRLREAAAGEDFVGRQGQPSFEMSRTAPLSALVAIAA
ncbi:hypothetical protein ACWGID_04375 [Kribbella sp. NPDC054772]